MLTYSTVHNIERVWMVQTESQYICIHQCLLTVLEGNESTNSISPTHVNQGYEGMSLANNIKLPIDDQRYHFVVLSILLVKNKTTGVIEWWFLVRIFLEMGGFQRNSFDIDFLMKIQYNTK